MPRNKDEPDYRLLSKVSAFYYHAGLTQQEIAETLHLSRQKVSRLLTQARELGIVQITVLPPQGVYAEIEAALEQAYGLSEAVVVEVHHDAPEVVVREIGVAAADYLQRTLADGDRIGISWGSTLKAMVDGLQPLDARSVHVVQILGGIGPPEAKEHVVDLSRRLAHLLEARLSLLPAPGLVESPLVRDALLSDPYVQGVLRLFDDLNVVYVGIGALATNTALVQEIARIRPDEYAELEENGAVGDIAMRFFDADGRALATSLDQRMIGIAMEQLQRVPRVVGVAGGAPKVAAIRGALQSGLLDVLITDHRTAAALLAPAHVPVA